MIDGGLSRLFQDQFPSFHWQRIESGLTGLGIPDINYCIKGCEGWIEFKFANSNKVTMRPDQVGWHLRRARAGGRTFIAVRYRHAGGPRRGAAVDSLYIYRGSDAKLLATGGLRTTPTLLCSGRWDWISVERLLRS